MEYVFLDTSYVMPIGTDEHAIILDFKKEIINIVSKYKMKNMKAYTTNEYPSWLDIDLYSDGSFKLNNIIKDCPVYINPSEDLINDAGLSDVWLLKEVNEFNNDTYKKIPFIITDKNIAIVIGFNMPKYNF